MAASDSHPWKNFEGNEEPSMYVCSCSLLCAVRAVINKNYVRLEIILKQSDFNIDDELDVDETCSDDDNSLTTQVSCNNEFYDNNKFLTHTPVNVSLESRASILNNALLMQNNWDSVFSSSTTEQSFDINTEGKQDLHQRFRCRLDDNCKQRQNNVCKLCAMETNDDLNSLLCYSLLQMSCKLGDKDALKIILQHQPTLDKFSSSGESALHIACKYGHVECVRLLINAGANVSLRHHIINGDSPLLTTVASCIPNSDEAMNYIIIARMLIDADCDVNMADDIGLAPIHIAATKFNLSLLRLLIENGADVNASSAFIEPPVIHAIGCKAIQNAILLVDAGCNVNAVVMPSNVTPLYSAIEKNLLPVILELLAAGADPTYGPREACPYHFAAVKGHVLVLFLLLTYCNRINCTNVFDGATLLITMCRHSSIVGVQMLLALGADPNIETKLGTTALFAAVKFGSVNIIRLLLEANCNLEAVSMEFNVYFPMTSLQLALELGLWGIVQVLLLAGAKLTPSTIANEKTKVKSKPPKATTSWLLRWYSNPRSLQQLCRVTIRAVLCCPLSAKLDLINYPLKLKHYILTKEL